MSFGSPYVLVALAAVPALAYWYVVAQRQRAHVAAAFAAPALAASVAPHRPGWRRHAGVIVVAAALIALIFAAARPRTTHAVPVEKASIMLVTDVSGSMLATDIAPSRMVAVKRAAQQFVDQVPKAVNVGLIGFNQAPQILQTPTKDRTAIREAIGRLTPSGGTATGTAIETATRLLSVPSGIDGRPAPGAIVLITDGASTRGVDPVTAATAAGKKKIPIYTVALGTAAGTITVPRPGGKSGTEVRKVPPDPASLEKIAKASGGQAFTADAADKLNQVYEKLGSQLGRRNEPNEITGMFAAGGLLLLLLGSGLSLHWFGRLV